MVFQTGATAREAARRGFSIALISLSSLEDTSARSGPLVRVGPWNQTSAPYKAIGVTMAFAAVITALADEPFFVLFKDLVKFATLHALAACA